MKNKLFIPLFLLTMGFGLVACQPDVDVLGINMDIAKETLVGGSDSARSVCLASGTTLKIIEYNFLPDSKATRTECIFGDGLQESKTVKYSYVMEFAEKNYGLNLTFTPEDAEASPLDVYFAGNVLIEKGGDTITDVNSKCDKLQTLAGQLSNTTWYYKDSTLWTDTAIVVDYIKYDTTYRVVIQNGRPVGKEPVVTVDTIWKEILDTIGVKDFTHIEFTFNRDLNTFANTGHYSYEHSEYTKDLVKIDSVSHSEEKDYRWGFSDISTARRFAIRTISDDINQEVVDYAISLFMEPIKDADKNVIGYTMKVDGATEFKLKK